jgi:hypothetical protein
MEKFIRVYVQLTLDVELLHRWVKLEMVFAIATAARERKHFQDPTTA